VEEGGVTDPAGRSPIETLRAFGTDFARWPEERATAGRRLLVGDLSFRAAFEAERRLDEAISAARDAEVADPALAAVAERVRSRAARLRRSAFNGFPWQRIAAAMLVAGMLGGVADLAFVERGVGVAADLALLDPLAALEEVGGE
jgi:hypothetical protein